VNPVYCTLGPIGAIAELIRTKTVSIKIRNLGLNFIVKVFLVIDIYPFAKP
jgi:hypothetical protein